MSEKNGNMLEKVGAKVTAVFKSIGEFFKKIPVTFKALINKKSTKAPKNKASSASKKRKGKIRYDRLGVLAAAVIVLIVLVVVLVKAIVASTKDETKDDDKDKSSNSGTSVSDSVSDTNGSASDTAVAYVESSFAYDQIKSGSLIAVNTNYEFIFPEAADPALISVMENKNSSYAVSNANILLDATVIKQLNTMMEAFSSETGLSNVELKQGYRTREYQQELYDSGTSVVAPGFTEHHTGLAFNISIIDGGDYKKYDYDDLPSDDYKWILDNCAKYGFVPRYTLEKETVTGCEAETDHFRYVGIPHAYYMMQNNLCLEEYLELLKSYTFDSPLQFTCEYDSKNYVVYYTEASVAVGVSDQTSVYIPTNAEYTVSGDNIGGFIVTVTQ
ncbi:MAG: M15 family metallopeptidase [Oscillospiraceae bacterium]|nr:M15 family metallopeptidase [Oscillospiraceae bacterium]